MKKLWELEESPWWSEKFLGVTWENWGWVLLTVAIFALIVFAPYLAGHDWDYTLGLRP